MQLRKKMSVLILAGLVCFQPLVRAKHEDLKALSAMIGICFLPAILKYMSGCGYGVYRTLKHKCGFEGPHLRKAKDVFMQNLHVLDLKDQCNWRDNCYCNLFNQSSHDPKVIENFIAGQEEYDQKKPLKLFEWTFEDLRDREKDLFVGIQCPRDDFDKNFFMQDICRSLNEYRKNQVYRFIGACCAAYPCKYGIEDDIKHEYPNISASKIFKAFRLASARSTDLDTPDTKKLISKQLLFACMEQ